VIKRLVGVLVVAGGVAAALLKLMEKEAAQ